jgi:hypothetical protein
MAILIAQGAVTSDASTFAAMRTSSFTIAMGGLLISLGIWKVITNAKNSFKARKHLFEGGEEDIINLEKAKRRRRSSITNVNTTEVRR